jgi:hypothetical protein
LREVIRMSWFVRHISGGETGGLKRQNVPSSKTSPTATWLSLIQGKMMDCSG